MGLSFGNLKILIVDDSRSMRRVVRGFLENGGAETVIEAGNGKSALKALASTSMDLVISDLNMPVMNGMELLEKIRREEADQGMEKSGLCFIMLTVEAIQKTMNQALAKGADAYIVKPVTQTVFLKTVLNTLEQVSSGSDRR